MDGIEFCRFVKDDFETSHIPFILLTAKDAQESRLQGAKSGADYYFSKPVSTEILLQTIKNQLNQQQKIKDRYLKDYQVEVRDLVHSTKDKEFMDRLLKIIENKLEEPELNIDYVSREIGVSKSKLYKKIKDITGQSSNEFIRTIRLKKSIEIMTNEDVSVTEVMYRVGISSHSYFTTAFKKEFGLTPSKFQQKLDRKTKVF
jgi:AraC-like DNA-binding protein